jgi:hypothetical protein
MTHFFSSLAPSRQYFYLPTLMGRMTTHVATVTGFGKLFFASPTLTQKLSNPKFKVLLFPNIPLSPRSHFSSRRHEKPSSEEKQTFDLTGADKSP